jgi:hypothetical protein
VEAKITAMRLHQRTTIIVVVVFVVLAALVFVLELRGGQETAPEEEGKVPVFSFDVDDAVTLEVTDETSSETVAVEKSPEGVWRLTAPFEAEADATRIDGLLGSLSQMKSTRVLEGEEVDLEAFGLAEPALRVEVGLADGGSQVLLVGSKNPAGYSSYVQREGGSQVYLVASSVMGDLERLISEPPEKPTPTPTGTPGPTVNPEPATPSAVSTPRATATVAEE